jgi:alanyl-tRNA synthetase
MMAHHAFNYPEREIYWKEETVELCHEYLTKILGIMPEAINYREEPWAGGGNAGPALEVIVGGLELATLVFMNLKQDPNGSIEVKGDKYSPMDLYIVDTGYGLERFVWISRGTPTIYDAIYPELPKLMFDRCGLQPPLEDPTHANILGEHAKLAGVIEVDTPTKLLELRRTLVKRLRAKGFEITEQELSALLTPYEQIYTIADHTRALAFMLGDGIVPSNMKAGYLARLIIRRTLRLLEELKLDLTLGELVMKHLQLLTAFPELQKSRKLILEMLDLETSRYNETMQKGKKLILSFARSHVKNNRIPLDALVDFYDSHGIHPTVVQRVARELQIQVEIPDNFNQMVAERHVKGGEPARPTMEGADWVACIKLPPDLAATELLYYMPEYETAREFDAKVCYFHDDYVVLDKTCFYPEGGGQPCDLGVLKLDGEPYEVVDVQKVGECIVHRIRGRIRGVEKYEHAHGIIDWERRIAHTRHHTATHMILTAARETLGEHVWQAGAQKGAERARLDITHYAKLSDDELQKIEYRSNELVLAGIPISKLWLPRNDAESKYGLRLYQGGPPATSQIRVVAIGDLDAQGCGGTHCNNTAEVSLIKLLSSERIQDGVVRLEYAAGLAAVREIQRRDKLLKESCNVVSVLPDDLPKTVTRFFSEWKTLRKEVAQLSKYRALVESRQIKEVGEEVHGVKIVTNITSLDMKGLIAVGRDLVKGKSTVGVFAGVEPDPSKGVKLIVVRTPDVNINCVNVLKVACEVIGGRGGGKPDFAQGGGPERAKVPEAIETAKKKIKTLLEQSLRVS